MSRKGDERFWTEKDTYLSREQWVLRVAFESSTCQRVPLDIDGWGKGREGEGGRAFGRERRGQVRGRVPRRLVLLSLNSLGPRQIAAPLLIASLAMAAPTSFNKLTSKVAPSAEAEGKQFAGTPLKNRVPRIPYPRREAIRLISFVRKAREYKETYVRAI